MQTKVCHSCSEEIKESAKQCPHCQSYQKGLAKLFKDPVFGTLIGLGIGLFIAMWFISSKFQDPIYDANGFLQISDTSIQFADASCGRQVSVVGTISNIGEKVLTDIVFDVEFFDSAGSRIDAFSDSQWDLIVVPGDSKSFKIRGDSGAKEALYAKHTITIAKAELDSW